MLFELARRSAIPSYHPPCIRDLYVTDLREEIVKTEKHEWREALHLEKQILEGVIEQLSV
jgi:hypothetical protein